MVAAIASTVSASPAKKPAPVAKLAPDNTLAVVVVSAMNGWGYEQSTTPVRVPFGKLTHFDKLFISSLEVRGVMVVGDGLPVPKDDKVRCHRYKNQYCFQLGSLEFKKGNPALISTGSVEFGWVLCRVEE
ncbi:hypothetical protein FIE12Z_11026 [Fusarium flagelliforme]|uniref:Uncharacterized protein n=1 Tax=Fusarium flagelliforme TaxID=2675880 RepID=A0A395MAA7_9HYPO|nr:hypothetical protein FIE12Z_11026 [Fusarium flagelliforme]